MISLTKLSNELDISKPALMARIRKISGFRNKYCKLRNHKLFISSSGVKLISYQKHDSTSKAFHTRKGSAHRVTKSDLVLDNHKLYSDLHKCFKSNYELRNQVRVLLSKNNLLRSRYVHDRKRLLRLPDVHHMSFIHRLMLLFGGKK